MARFYLNQAGNTTGPHEEAAVVEMLQSKQIDAAAQICPEGHQLWTAITTHPPFGAALTSGSAPAAPVKATAAMPAAAPAPPPPPPPAALPPVVGAPGAGLPPGARVSHPSYATDPRGSMASIASASAPPPAKRRGVKLVALGCGALVVLGGLATVIGAGIYFYTSGNQLTPFKSAQLPPTTESVNISRVGADRQADVGMDESLLPTEAYWSLMAGGPCGGRDLYRLLMTVPTDYAKAPGYRRRPIAEYLGPKLIESKRAMHCGRGLTGDSLDADSSMHRVRFKLADKTHSFQVLELAGETMPNHDGAFKKRAYGDHTGYCKPELPQLNFDATAAEKKAAFDSAKCLEKGLGITILDKQWVFGDVAAIEELVKSYDKEADELAPGVEVLEELAEVVKKSDSTRLSTDRKSTRPVNSLLLFYIYRAGASVIPAEKMVPKEKEAELAKDIQAKTRAVGMATRIPRTDSGGYLTYLLHAKDPGAAESLETAIDHFRKDWRVHLDTSGSQLTTEFQSKLEKKSPEAKDYQEAIYDALVRAIPKGEVKRSGLTVQFTITLEPNSAEKKRIARYLERHKARSAAAARVIKALTWQKDPAPADLVAIGGKEMVDDIEKAKKGELPPLSGGLDELLK